MSAIAGIIERDERDTSESIKRMMRMMAHRTQGKYHLFRTRTAQIAGRAGIEEAAFLRHKVIAVFEGELHHPETLKEVLKERGHACHDDSAEGLLLLAYLEWGEECLKRLHGDFICALFDIEQDLLILARDPLAKRPLYWFGDAERVLFASEMKALLATCCIPHHICMEGLATYFALGCYPLETTPLMGVYKLLPGYFLRIGPDWTPTAHYFGPTLHELEEESAQVSRNSSLQEILQANLKKQQETCHSAGCILSGGLGSAALGSLLAASRSDQRLHAWVVEWEGMLERKSNQLQRDAHDLSIPCDVVVMRPESMLQEMLSMVWYLDEPVINMEVWTIWKVAHMGSTSTEALYMSFGIDAILPYLYEMQRIGDFQPSRWKQGMGKIRSLLPLLGRGVDAIMQRMPLHIRMKWTKYFQEAPQELTLFYSIWWTSYSLLEQAAPRLLEHFDARLCVLQKQCTSGMTMHLDPYIHLYCMTQGFSGLTQPAERLLSAFGLKCVTPYMEYKMLLLLRSLMNQNPVSLLAKFYQILLPVLPTERLSALKVNKKLSLPPWSHHPGFIQAFEMLQEGVLVRSGWVSRTWLKIVLEDPQHTSASFGFLLAMLQWEMWYKMFIEETPHECPSPLSVTQFLHR